jgi:hypothetical protein
VGFLETVERARSFLERHGRVSRRGLRREFGLDAETLGSPTSRARIWVEVRLRDRVSESRQNTGPA